MVDAGAFEFAGVCVCERESGWVGGWGGRGEHGQRRRPASLARCACLLPAPPADTPKFLEAASELAGPYLWGRYDLLLLPPSFPYGAPPGAVAAPLAPQGPCPRDPARACVGTATRVLAPSHPLQAAWKTRA